MAATPLTTEKKAAAEKPKGKLVGAVVSASKVLRFLRATQGPCTVTQITRALQINPSTCFNILKTLIQEDFVQFDAASKTYQLSLGLVALARGALEHSAELQLLKPRISELSGKYRMMVAIWRKISDERMMLVAAAESDAAVRIHAQVGARSPLLLGATGRVFAAHSGMSRQLLKERFQEVRLERPLAFKTYMDQLEQVRAVGWAIDNGHAAPGTITIAVPVYGLGGEVNFACAAILFNGQFDFQRTRTIAEDLQISCGSTLIEAGLSVVNGSIPTSHTSLVASTTK
jgi:DNA-binding IclR family transcriptional regulator